MSTQNNDGTPWGEEDDSPDEFSGDNPIPDNKVTQLAAHRKDGSRSDAIRREHRDIVARAKALSKAGFIDFPDVKTIVRGGMPMVEVQLTDTNRFKVLDVMFGGSDIPKPHLDEFRGRIVDHRGRTIDDQYPVVEWVEMFRYSGMRGLSAESTRKTLREWALARRWNDLIDRVERKIPKWDGVPRLETYMVELFEPIDTPLMRDISRYFWLSLYMRVMIPGSQAPIVLSLFGAQNCGKSWFGTRLVRIITGNENADSVQLDLGADKINFLREITGTSVIAAIGEMTGFNRGDLNKIKDFCSRVTDRLHFKFEGHIEQPRQWCVLLDGNSYSGLQRDDTGNRRFMPVFCGQLPDVNGQPAWRTDFAKGPFIASQQFEDDVWQLLAEAAAWYEANGDDAYSTMVSDTSKKVFAFSQNEMANDRGTIGDDALEIYLVPMLKNCPKFVWKMTDGRVGVGVRTGEFRRYFVENAQQARPVWRHLKNKMMALGAIEHHFTGGYPGYFFNGFDSIDAFIERVGVRDYDGGGAVVTYRKGDEGF